MADLLEMLFNRHTADFTEEYRECITKREREVIRYVPQGMTNKEIAKTLGISDKTVKAHLGHVFRKLKVGRHMKLLRTDA